MIVGVADICDLQVLAILGQIKFYSSFAILLNCTVYIKRKYKLRYYTHTCGKASGQILCFWIAFHQNYMWGADNNNVIFYLQFVLS